MRIWTLGLFLLLPALARGDQVADIIRLHINALGGAERIEELTSLRATGQVVAGGKRLRFSFTAERPNRVRLETENGGRSLIQAFDGKEPAWEFDTGTWPPRYQPMREEAAKPFVADAEFDDPLVAGAKRGYTFDYAGEANVQGRAMFRLLVTRNLTETFSLLIDAKSFLIALRVEQRATPGGRTLQIITRYDDYRLVNRVLLPHRVTVATEGGVEQQTNIDEIQPNPELTAETFRRPRAGGSEPRNAPRPEPGARD